MFGPESSLSSFLDSWKIQKRVVAALLIREMLTRYGRHNIGFLWLFVEPMMFTLGVTALWTAAGLTHGSNLPIVAFALTGYSSVLLWRNMPARCIGAILPNLSLLYHRNVKVLDVLLARLLLEGGGASISFAILSLFFVSIGWIRPPEDILQVLGGWSMIAWFGMSTAILLGVLSEQNEIVDKLWHPASYLLFPLSGAAFLVDALPQDVQPYALYLPMVNGVEFIREGYFGSAIVAHYDMAYMATFNALLTISALVMTRKVSREVVPG
ncbi:MULTISPECIES: ABC transporter permease [Sphingobium]|uniref:ABC transporter permease n=1 Tax=Sphingobium TaxID=165695 RepID=UPI0015ECD34C|nr:MULTISPECIES: ABC transporter permease [Sphingobium]MCW2361372.1 ABC-2 type transport system permease protein/capsular polysaccharide transport system permease protein [Sphingobium sp. B10D3B]MCW2401949.1 ABC-2 type transport system permease protein/capsular polysaccharide transport system permease protein [Sphingobium sp. B10D7B]MCW2408928.1 ABC-2 type transport system permease protein/capsular polysaccharide transport system permease protein [Sphingobium xanthum]